MSQIEQFQEILDSFHNGQLKQMVDQLDDLLMCNFVPFINWIEDPAVAVKIFKAYFNIKSRKGD